MTPKDTKAIQMAKKALEFAIKNDLTLSYSGNTFYFYFEKHKRVSETFTYLDWGNREELFEKMMAEAKELI